MNLFKLLNGNNYLTFNREMAREIGINASIFLSELLDKFEYFQKQGVLKEDGWFYLTIESAEERTTLGRDAQDGAIKKLKDLGFIQTKQIGMPAKRHFKIIKEKITEWVYPTTLVEESRNLTEESRNQGCNFSATKDVTFPQPTLYSKEPKEEPKVSVCYLPPVGLDIEHPDSDKISKEEVSKKNLEEVFRGLALPQALGKESITGGTIKVSLQDIFLKASQNRTDWKVEEIHDAWKVLDEYQGKIREPFAFIEGTIKNMRTKKKSKFLKTKESKWKKSDSPHTTESKENLLESDLSEHPSLGSILEQMGINL